MVTPVFTISDYSLAVEFYVGWLGFRIDWEERPARGPAYVQVSRGDVVLHLSAHPGQSAPGATARAEVKGLSAYHAKLLGNKAAFTRPSMAQASWHARVLEMEVVDPFGNRLIFCE